MGAETTKRTRQALLESLKACVTEQLDDSIEREKEHNDFLMGVDAIVEGMRNRRIECRVYTKEKFHAKAYITHSKLAVVGSAALVGASNFTKPGLTQNVELNIQIRREVELVQNWFEHHWDEADDITPELTEVIDRHVRDYQPFEVYAKALQEFFKGHEMTVGEWEQDVSRVYRLLDQYQKEGYQSLMKIAGQYRGARDQDADLRFSCRHESRSASKAQRTPFEQSCVNLLYKILAFITKHSTTCGPRTGREAPPQGTLAPDYRLFSLSGAADCKLE